LHDQISILYYQMFDGLRKYIGGYYFRRELSKILRERKITNLQEARKIGILYTLDDVPVYETVSEFVTQLQQDHKEVKALGYVKKKEMINRFLPKLSYDFFSSKDINCFFKPIHTKVNDFISKEFDILIDLSLKDSLPLKYICGLSMAHCRIGRYSEENTVCYDLMLDIGSDTSLKDYIRQIIHYSTIINKQ
jgi:hypothetical protein